MNLAVHGLEGDIREANTFYEDAHSLYGKCDFVMANPPFNVDMVDAEKVKDDRRLPFGLPGVNKAKKVSNGNYLWISYFHSYLNDKGRAGFVMSSQASSAGHGETEVRRKLVETGDVDVMIAIRSNFFYTRTVPCELWHLDKGKPEERRDQVLMLDARNVYRKVTRKIYDFSPEQLANLTAIVWLYRGQQERFLDLVKDYFGKVSEEIALVPAELTAFDKTLAELRDQLQDFADSVAPLDAVDTEKKQPLTDALAELAEAQVAYESDRESLIADLEAFGKKTARHRPPPTPTSTSPARPSTRWPSASAAWSSRWTCSTSSPPAPGSLPTIWPVRKTPPSTTTAALPTAASSSSTPSAKPRSNSSSSPSTSTARSSGCRTASPTPSSSPCRACARPSPRRNRGRRLEPDPGPLRRRRPARGGRGLRLRADPARHPRRTGRPEPRGGGAGGEDSGELRGVGGVN